MQDSGLHLELSAIRSLHACARRFRLGRWGKGDGRGHARRRRWRGVKKKKKNEASFAKVSILSAATTEKAEEKQEENSQIGHPNRRTSARLPHPMKNSRAVAVLCAARCAFHHIGAEARDIFEEAFVASAPRSRTFYGYEICAVPGERVNKKGLSRATADRAARTILGRAAPAAGGGGPSGRGGPTRNRETPVRGMQRRPRTRVCATECPRSLRARTGVGRSAFARRGHAACRAAPPPQKGYRRRVCAAVRGGAWARLHRRAGAPRAPGCVRARA